MKKIFNVAAVALSVAVLASCGGASEADVVGKWKVDASSVEVELGDAFPAEMKGEVEEGLKEAKSEEAQKEMDKITFDFQEGGKLVVSAEGRDKTQEAKWSIADGKLVIEGEFEGQKGKLALNCDVSGDVMTISLTGEEILAQIKEQQPDALEMMKAMSGGKDVEEIAKGISVKVSMKKSK